MLYFGKLYLYFCKALIFNNMDFQDIYKEFYPKILNYIHRMLNDYELAEDFTQEVFIRVNNRLASFEGRSKISTWIYKIATNITYDYFKSPAYLLNKKNTQGSEMIEQKDLASEIWTGEQSQKADATLEKKEMNSCIKRYVQDISENYRTVFVLSEYEGMKNKEIAEILGLSIDTVKIRIYRARTQLRQKMEKGCKITYEEDGIICDEK